MALPLEADGLQFLTGIKGGLDLLAAALHLAATDVFALHGLDLQFADLMASSKALSISAAMVFISASPVSCASRWA